LHNYLNHDLETYIQQALFILFSVCFIIQLYFLLNKQSILARYKPLSDTPEASLPVSVIISARNEEKNLQENLPFILQQDYPDFEVIVINDRSYDSTDMMLLELKEANPHLKIVTVADNERYQTSKKFAITLGIKAAKNEHLLFTDADCKPASPNWIKLMASNFTGNTSIVLGYSAYDKTNNFLNPFIRFETIKTAINYFSAALKGNAYMGVGRNLAYTKSLFFGAKGFASHMHVLSGDDDLFVNQNATKENAGIEINPDAFTYTKAKTSLFSWYRQKKRHFGVGKLYRKRHQLMLGTDAFTGLMFYILLTLCLIFNFQTIIVIGLFIFRLIFQLIIYSKLFKRFGGRYLLWYFPVLDVLYYIYLNIFGLIGTFTKTTQWK